MSAPWIFAFIAALALATGVSWWRTSTQYPLEPLTSTISDCAWSPQSVDSFNNHKLYPLLNLLTERIFFTYWKVNYWRDCEIWEDDHAECTWEPGKVGGCQICPCDTEEIPVTWRCEDNGEMTSQKLDELITSLPHKEDCNSTTDDAFWSIEEPDPEELWTVYDHSEEYINLQLNPERNTGYGGEHARKIWQAIYQENCFSGKLENQCLEERAFYRLVSGIHGSTAVQVAERYNIISEPQKLSGNNFGADRWEFEPNVPFYAWSVGKWPDRAENIYFTWSVLLRAFHKAHDSLQQFPIDTGNAKDDERTKQLIKQILQEGDCPTAGFDEKHMFAGGEYKDVLKSEFKAKFRNVSRIMDCVACQNCRIHGKLSMLGIATAMKILLDEEQQQPLQRNELIALVNTLYKFSESIRVMELMHARIFHIFLQQAAFIALALETALVVLFFLSRFLRAKPTPSNPPKRKGKSKVQ